MNSQPDARFPVMLWRSFIVLGLLLSSSTGCQQRTASKLLGRWEGHPDSAASRAAREAEKYGDAPRSIAESTEGSAAKTAKPAQVTDWENYEVTILMDFVSSERLEMSLADDAQPRSASWQIIATSPTGCTIEVQTESPANENQEPTTERRRFELVLDERDGECVGFLLTEVGADRQLGAIYFKRRK